MERRRHQRIIVRKLTVDASDGIGFLQGDVTDISKCGLRVSDLQRRKIGQPSRMTFVISGQGEHFKMTVKPRWCILQGASKSIGAEIVEPSLSWAKFITSFEPGE